MTDHGRFAVDRWLRAEALARRRPRAARQLGVSPGGWSGGYGRRRVNQGAYAHAVERQFTPDQMARLQLNPEWAAVERALYAP